MTMVAMRAELATLVDAVVGVGTVYEYGRFTVPPVDFPSVFQVAGRVDYATVRPTNEARQLLTNIERLYTYTFEVTIIKELVDPDSSEVTFHNLLDTIADAIELDETLSGTIETLAPDQDYINIDYGSVQSFNLIANVHLGTITTIAQELIRR